MLKSDEDNILTTFNSLDGKTLTKLLPLETLEDEIEKGFKELKEMKPNEFKTRN